MTGRSSVAARLRAGIVGGALAGAVSGVPSTLHAALSGRDVLESSRAAGSLLVAASARDPVLLGSAFLVHGALSLGWGIVLSLLLPPRRTVLWGVLGGAGIAALDLGVVGRRRPLIRRLPVVPQVADHLVYGAVVGLVVSRRRAAGRAAALDPTSRAFGASSP